MTKQDFTTRSAPEARTYELLHKATEADGWSPDRAVIAMVFRACWSNSLTVERIRAIGQAMAGYGSVPEGWLQDELTKLTREKVLRSHVMRGKRHYEVNY